jgi:putative RecB family exonuclease
VSHEPLREVYSPSRLNSFEQCPKKFEYRYVLKLPSETEGIEGFTGKRVHEVIERLHLVVAKGQVPSLEKVMRRFRILWDEHYDAERIRIVRKGLGTGFYIKNGERCLENFYRRHYPFEGDETVGIEDRVRFDLDDDGRYKMQGIVDRIVRARDGAIEIHDYKTGQRVPSQKQLDGDRQLAFYQMGLTPRLGYEKPYRLVWHYLLKDQVRTSTRTPEQIESLRSDTITLIDKIRDTTEFPAKPSALCDWCEFGDRCPEGPGSSDAAPVSIPKAASATTSAVPGAPEPPAPGAEPRPTPTPSDEASPGSSSAATPARAQRDKAEPTPSPPRSGQLSLL